MTRGSTVGVGDKDAALRLVVTVIVAVDVGVWVSLMLTVGLSPGVSESVAEAVADGVATKDCVCVSDGGILWVSVVVSLSDGAPPEAFALHGTLEVSVALSLWLALLVFVASLHTPPSQYPGRWNRGTATPCSMGAR